MEEQIKNTVASGLRIGVTALNRFIQRFLRIVGDDVESIDTRIEKKFAAKVALGFHDCFDLFNCSGISTNPPLPFAAPSSRFMPATPRATKARTVSRTPASSP